MATAEAPPAMSSLTRARRLELPWPRPRIARTLVSVMRWICSLACLVDTTVWEPCAASARTPAGSARRRLLPRQAPQPVGDRSSIATGLTAASSPVSLRAGRDLGFPATGPTASSSPVSLRTALLRVPQLIEQRSNVCSGVDNKFCVGV